MQSGDKDNEDGWLTSMEEQYLQDIGAEPDYERQYNTERESSMRNVWASFQESATSIAQLYRDRLSSNETGALWLPFQTAAGTVTSLYKESSDGLKRTSETAIQCGYQRRTRELADWARKRNRRYIRREELLAYLAGKPPPPSSMHTIKPLPAAHHYHHHHSHSNANSINSSNNSSNHHLHRIIVAAAPKAVVIGDISASGEAAAYQQTTAADSEQLVTFREALARRSRAPDLYAFVAGEIARHCKRPASPLDINMDVQNINSKRQRFL